MITWLTSLVAGPTVRLVIAGLCLAGAAAGGASLMADHKNLQIAALKANHTAAAARNTQEALSRLVAERRRGDALESRFAAADSQRQLLAEEKSNAVRRLTTGRPCLDGPVVRLLNSADGLKPAAVPTTTGQPAGTDAGFASDTDVALWANSARRHYDTCRGRLDAVAAFFPEETSE